MDLQLVSERLAALAAALPEVKRSDPYVPDAATPIHFYVAEFEIDYDQTYGGLMDVQVVCRLLTSRGNDRSGQAALKPYMARRGDKSLKYALEGDPGVPQTLDGACHDLHVRRLQGHRLYKVGEDYFYGAEWLVRVVGTDSEEA
ncbi:hypothetical protein ACN27G_06005 [Plantactinospora sp. WMMB334]|uniref:hypothetical protein n=1 Tax=Plantactinospora sp. WMMB334 TaxID=3404119 RepID=UPI003B94B6C6